MEEATVIGSWTTGDSLVGFWWPTANGKYILQIGGQDYIFDVVRSKIRDHAGDGTPLDTWTTSIEWTGPRALAQLIVATYPELTIL